MTPRLPKRWKPTLISELTPEAHELLIRLSKDSITVHTLLWAPLELVGARFASSCSLKRGFVLTITDRGREAIAAELSKVEAAECCEQ